MIILKKARLKQVLFVIIMVVILALISIGLGLLEAWLVNRYFPDPQNFPWQRIYPAFSVPKQGYAIYVDLDLLRLTLYKDGEIFK